ncbi:siroheme synthase CysG [Marinobacteraceae bacterium S3BR75-40.1]
MKTLPLSLDVSNTAILCMGDSARLISKAERFWLAGAELVWLGNIPDAWADLERVGVAGHGADRLPDGAYRWGLVDTGDNDENRRVGLAWQQQGLDCWIQGLPEASRLHFPATVERGPLRVALDTGGENPVVSRWARQQLEKALPKGLGPLLEKATQRLRQKAESLNSSDARRRFWNRLLEGPLSQGATARSDAQLSHAIDTVFEEALRNDQQGRVFLIGAGPGDPDLLTVKALRLIGQADVVVYDRLVSSTILNMIRSDAERIHVGKKRSKHTVPQQGINQMLVDLARSGKTVVRLKGGDPFIFGRGGEEIETLAEAGIGFEVVPGITAASGCAAYSGIPLTHRDYAQSVRFVTGHLKNNTTDLPWNDLVQGNQTLVFYMGLVGLPIIARELINHGMSGTMPVALVSQGTLPDQVVVTGTLDTIADRVDASGVKAPTLVIVGEVVKLREQLDWLGDGIVTVDSTTRD